MAQPSLWASRQSGGLSLRWNVPRDSDIIRTDTVAGRLSMAEKDDYRRHAADLVRLAQRASAPADKRRLLGLAEAWLDLIDGSKALAERYRRRRGRILPVKDPYQSGDSPD
jgi:hypothetical protein